MKYLQQVFDKNQQGGKCDPSKIFQMISEFYTLKTGKQCDAKTVSDLLTQNEFPPPKKLEFVDFCYYATNFGMMMATKDKNENEYGEFYLLFTYGSYDPKGTGTVSINAVVKRLVEYFGKMNPNITEESVEQVINANGVQMGTQINFETFSKLFKAVYDELKQNLPLSHR